MAYVYARINKETMKFIRTQRLVSFDYITKKTAFQKEKIELWENEKSNNWPTINQAKKLADCYHIPFAGFYMESKDINVKHIPTIRNMRTFHVPVNDESAVNLAILDLLNDREFYVETKAELKESISKFNLHIVGNSVYGWAREIRAYLELDIKEQYASTSSRKLYLLLRDKIESKGIFVQCFKGVDPEVMRGVAIFDGDSNPPIIGINDNDRYPAKIFTILHELVHIIKRSSSMCNEIYNSDSSNREEIFCNAVAGEILIPSNILKTEYSQWDDADFDLDTVGSLASRFSVSSEVTARRLMDCQICSPSWYRSISNKLTEKYLKSKEENRQIRLLTNSGGIPRNMPREAIDRTSSDMCRVLIRGYSEGMFDKTDVSSHIGIKEKHIDNFVAEVLKWYR